MEIETGIKKMGIETGTEKTGIKTGKKDGVEQYWENFKKKWESRQEDRKCKSYGEKKT